MSVRRRRRRCQVITIITILLALQRTRFIATFNLLCRGDLARNHQAYRFFKLLPPQSPRGFSALARLYYLERPAKTAMLRRLASAMLELMQVSTSMASQYKSLQVWVKHFFGYLVYEMLL